MLDLLQPKSLQDARKAAGLSRSQLATLSGIHETTIGRIENGQVDPRVHSTWAPLVRVLNTGAASDHLRAVTTDEARASGDIESESIARGVAA